MTRLRHSKHGMYVAHKDGMESKVTIKSKVVFAALSVVVLSIGVSIAAYYGDFSMRPKDEMHTMENMHPKE